MPGFTFLSVPRIVAETGGLDRLGTLMAGLGARRVAIVCDRGDRYLSTGVFPA